MSTMTDTLYECRRCGSRWALPYAACIGMLGTIDPKTDRYIPSGIEHDPELPIERERR